MTRSAILVVLLSVAVLAGCKDSKTDDKPEEESPPAIVFTQERSTGEDVIYLRDDTELRGQVIDSSLSVAAPYGEVSIAADRCARVAIFEDDEADEEAWIQVIITVNGDRITGASTEPAIRFRDGSSGEEIQVAKKDVWFIALRKGADELGFIDAETPADRFIMTNGDLLTGHAAEDDLMIRTDSGEICIPFAEIATVRMPSEGAVNAAETDEETEPAAENTIAVVSKRNHDVLRGAVSTEAVTLNLQMGVTIQAIGADNLARIHTGEGGAVTNSIGMEMVMIPAGEFMMGSPADEELRDEDETRRQVTLTSDFLMSAMEVTQGEWVSIMGEYPSEFKGGLLPVENISWEEAVEFCNALSTIEGLPVAYEVKQVEDVSEISFLDAEGQPTSDVTQVKGYRLPTEAEWEYACRAGTTTTFSTGNTISTDQANFDGRGSYGGGSEGDALETAVPVGSYEPNAWGLYDMHGNVWEWCHDLYGTYSPEAVTDPTGAEPGASRLPRTARVLRGGGWSGGAEFCRSAYRAWCGPASGDRYLGFRVVRGVD